MNFYLLFFIIALAFIWFKTEAVPEYLSLFRFKFHKFDEFRKDQFQGSPFNYVDWLLVKYPNFFVRLITCPYCLIVWFNILTVPFIETRAFGLQLVASWVGYFSLEKFLAKLNE